MTDLERVLVTPSLALAEVAGAVRRRSGAARLAQRAVQAIEALPRLRIVVPDAALWVVAWRMAAGQGLRGSDAVYVALARLLDIPLLTLDSEQTARAGRGVIVLAPGQLM
jgi:predicted nucleic acid-binding protein